MIAAMGPEPVEPIESENFIEFKCPYCGKTVSFLDAFVGRVQECPECFEAIVVPDEETEFGGKLELPIRTERLLLRPLTENDVESLAEGFLDEKTFRYCEASASDEATIQKWLRAIAASTLTTSYHA